MADCPHASPILDSLPYLNGKACKVEVCAGCGKYRWQPADGPWSDWLDFVKLPVFDNAR